MIDIRMWDEKMNYDLIIARYGEIGIKSSKVRARFERKLVKNIKATFCLFFVLRRSVQGKKSSPQGICTCGL